MVSWYWERLDASRSASSGDLGKAFKNEPVKQPGLLANNAPPVAATVMAREVIQNSWDAAHDLRSSLAAEETATPDFEIQFEFTQLRGAAKNRMSEVLGLRELAERSSRHPSDDLGIGASCLERLGSKAPLRLLRIHEHGTSGMYGSWISTESKMYLALVSQGMTQKGSHAGGSFGYGKAGLIRGSATRTVVAYSCFRERPDDPGVTRRLLGMTYWGQHGEDGEHFAGFARLGDIVAPDDVRPFENDQADEIAESLGLRPRSADHLDDLGTSYLLVDPTVEPEDLNEAIERNWWPALEFDGGFHAEVIDFEGESTIPRPKRNPVLRDFVRAFEVAFVPQDNQRAHERPVHFRKTGIDYEIGSMGLVADPDGWSFPDDPAGADTQEPRSLVALIRSPRMVVEYFDAGGRTPHVRGAFIASEAIDHLLRQTEPKAHDEWITSDDDERSKEAHEVARIVMNRIRSAVDSWRLQLRPPAPDRREIRLPDLERLFGSVFNGDRSSNRKPPPPAPRDVMISIVAQRLEADPSMESKIRLHSRIGLELADHLAAESYHANVSIRYKFLEDDRAGDDCPLTIRTPSGFKRTETGFIGPVGRKPVHFDVQSESYDSDWSGRLVIEAVLASEEHHG